MGTTAPARFSALDRALRTGLRSVFQPVVEIATGDIVAFEALTRGPHGSPLESPAALFAAATAEGRTRELDRACSAAAVNEALRVGLRAPTALFVNVEPEGLGAVGGDERVALMRHATDRGLRIFFEVTERALAGRPAELLRTVELMRGEGFGIALDDVGADRRSLALLPLLRPDVVKLDMSLIHDHPSRRSGEVMNGVCAYAEHTGAAIVAEGIETERHLIAACSMGASLGQGWYYGRPGPLPALPVRGGSQAHTLGLPARVLPGSPAALVEAHRELRVGRKDVLLSVTRALEAQALELGEHAVVAAAFQHARHFTPATRRHYEQLGERSALTVALAEGLPARPAAGVRGADLDADDELIGEWDIAVLAPHYAGALVARDLGDAGPDSDRRFAYALTFDRELVVDVAATLLARITDRQGR